ncbi:hypothetical protein TNCV_2402341 [Trichonephila clavipes]|nr:hypothetical protein TNCV_2402341 [Trichonephila clavipes]
MRIAKTRYRIALIPTNVNIFEENSKQQRICLEGSKDYLSDSDLEIELGIPFTSSAILQRIINNQSSFMKHMQIKLIIETDSGPNHDSTISVVVAFRIGGFWFHQQTP